MTNNDHPEYRVRDFETLCVPEIVERAVFSLSEFALLATAGVA